VQLSRVGLALHVTDLFLDELVKVTQSADLLTPPPSALSALLQPFAMLFGNTGAKHVQQRVASSVFKRVLAQASPSKQEQTAAAAASTSAAAPTKPSKATQKNERAHYQLLTAVERMLFEVAADKRTRQGRARIYKLNQMFHRGALGWERIRPSLRPASPSPVRLSGGSGPGDAAHLQAKRQNGISALKKISRQAAQQATSSPAPKQAKRPQAAHVDSCKSRRLSPSQMKARLTADLLTGKTEEHSEESSADDEDYSDGGESEQEDATFIYKPDEKAEEEDYSYDFSHVGMDGELSSSDEEILVTPRVVTPHKHRVRPQLVAQLEQGQKQKKKKKKKKNAVSSSVASFTLHTARKYFQAYMPTCVYVCWQVLLAAYMRCISLSLAHACTR
jgi:Nucleolar protein,Nop52